VDPESTVERIKLLGNKRWPKDRYGDEIDIGDYLMFVHWNGYPSAALGHVVRIDRGGKVHVETLTIHAKDSGHEVKIKEPSHTTKLSKNVVNALTLDKLARE
jgi:hypothetical protein